MAEYLNQSEIAARYDVDRATARNRLEAAGIPFKTAGKTREKRYLVTPELEAAMLPEEQEAYDAARARKLRVEADLKEIELQQAKGELLPAYEVREQVQKIVQRLYQKFAIQQPRELAARLAKIKTSPGVEKALREEAAKVFADLRRDHSKMLSEQ